LGYIDITGARRPAQTYTKKVRKIVYPEKYTGFSQKSDLSLASAPAEIRITRIELTTGFEWRIKM
jgi:hypothetical protein